MVDVSTMSFVAIGRKYGVFDSAVRKWIRWWEYERERGDSSAQDGSLEAEAA